MKKKGNGKRKRVLTDPVYERTWENNAEFDRAAKANGVLLHAFFIGLSNYKNRSVSGWLTKTMFRILLTDPVNGRGERTVQQGMVSLLEGHNFKKDSYLQQVFRAPYSVTFDQEAMRVSLHIPAFISQTMIDPPYGSNAFILTAMAASVDFKNKMQPVTPEKTDVLPVSLLPQPDLVFQMPVIDHQPGNTIVVALGIEFYNQEHKVINAIDKDYNRMAVVKVFNG